MYCFWPALHQEGAAQTEGGRQLSWDESTWAETAGGWRELNFVETTGVLLTLWSREWRCKGAPVSCGRSAGARTVILKPLKLQWEIRKKSRP